MPDETRIDAVTAAGADQPQNRLRVAAVQFATGLDLDDNLATCLRLIDDAADAGAELIVLPEFSNHISVYDDAEHCRAVAVPLDGAWLGAIAERAATHACHVVVTVTVPKPDGRVTVTNVMFGPDGALLGTADKNTLMGNERAHLSGGDGDAPVVATTFGPVGLYSCMDGVTFETPRSFAVRGARLLTNSLNSFALDEAALHIPVRAVENGVFVVAANKVGPLLPADQVAAFSAALGIPPEALHGAGESQIVAPDGEVLAQGPREGEAVVIADIDLTAARPDDHLRHRRPELYRPLAAAATAEPSTTVAAEVAVACAPDPRKVTTIAATLAAAVGDTEADLGLLVLPEGTGRPATGGDGRHLTITSAFVDTADGVAHEGQIWRGDDLLHQQRQLHATDRLPAVTDLGDTVTLLDTSIGAIALVVGDDHRYPETVRLAAIQGAHIVVVLWEPTVLWEATLALPERAAENRVSLVACASAATAARLGAGATMLLDPPADSLWNPDRSAPYNGTINTPDRVTAAPTAAELHGTIHPIRSLNREISKNTDLVGGRSWQVSRTLTLP